MKKKIIWIVSVVLIVLLFAGASFLYNNLSEKYTPESVTESATQIHTEENKSVAASDFSVLDNDSNTVNLSDYFGKPIVLNFWASWCPPCKAEMPHFEEAYKENPDIQFLMVNVTSGDKMPDAKAFIEEQGFTFPVLYDVLGSASGKYNTSSLPVTFFIDKDGNIVTHSVGMLTKERLEEKINLIKE